MVFLFLDEYDKDNGYKNPPKNSKAFGVLGAEFVEIAANGEQTPQRDLMVGILMHWWLY